jgi:hypothetical protein
MQKPQTQNEDSESQSNAEPKVGSTGQSLCEGKPGTVILGSEKNDVVVGVVSGLREHKTEVLSFPIRSGTQNGFCAFPIRIETYPSNCEPDVGALPGCKPIKGCRSFAVIDDECDSFNFYWDSSRRALGWWRH